MTTEALEVHDPNAALVVAPTDVLALPTDDPWSGVEDGYIGAQAPEIAPVLPLLGFNAKSDGGFTDEATGERFKEGDTLRVVWLAWSENRAWWEKAFGQGDKMPSCRSADMIHPDPSSPLVQAETCAACPMSKWTDDGPPACGIRLNVMVYLLDEQRITRTSFAGLSLKHIARYLGSFKARAGGRPPMAFVTEITVTAEDTANGTFLVPQFRLGEAIDFAEARPLIALRDEFLAQWKSLLAEDWAAAVTLEGGGPVVGPFDDDGTRTPDGAVDVVSGEPDPGRPFTDDDDF